MDKIGFIGTGAISEAVVIGLCKLVHPPSQITVSPRNEARAKALAERFSNVQIAADNQGVIDASDTVCLAIRPDIAIDVLSGLKFRAGQQIISIVAIVPLVQLAQIVAPATEIVRMVPLPPIADHRGPNVMCPPNEKVAAIFGQMGTLVQVEDETRMQALATVTAMMGSYFGFLKHMALWLEDQDIAPELARETVASMCHALAMTSMEHPELSFADLVHEHSTPGGLNEQALRELERVGLGMQIKQVLSLIEARMNGKADFDSTITG